MPALAWNCSFKGCAGNHVCVARVSPALIFQQLTVNHYESLNFPYDVGEFLRSPFMDCLAHIRAACVSTKRAPPEGHHGTPGIREGDAYFTCCQVQTHYKELRMYSSQFFFFWKDTHHGFVLFCKQPLLSFPHWRRYQCGAIVALPRTPTCV